MIVLVTYIKKGEKIQIYIFIFLDETDELQIHKINNSLHQLGMKTMINIKVGNVRKQEQNTSNMS